MHRYQRGSLFCAVLAASAVCSMPPALADVAPDLPFGAEYPSNLLFTAIFGFASAMSFRYWASRRNTPAAKPIMIATIILVCGAVATLVIPLVVADQINQGFRQRSADRLQALQLEKTMAETDQRIRQEKGKATFFKMAHHVRKGDVILESDVYATEEWVNDMPENAVRELPPMHVAGADIPLEAVLLKEMIGPESSASLKARAKKIGADRDAAAPIVEKATALSDAGKCKDAMKWYEKAMKLDPGNPAAYLGRGKCFSAQGEYSKAIEDFNVAIKFGAPHAVVQRSDAFLHLKQYDKALNDVKECTQLKEDEQPAYVIGAKVWIAKGDPQAAQNWLSYADLDDSAEKGELHYQISRLWAKNGHQDIAAEHLESAKRCGFKIPTEAAAAPSSTK